MIHSRDTVSLTVAALTPNTNAFFRSPDCEGGVVLITAVASYSANAIPCASGSSLDQLMVLVCRRM